jgi:hypothetical protein
MSKLPTFTAAFLLAVFATYTVAEETIFSGRYEYRTDQESLDIIGQQVCFYPSEPSARLVPRPGNDNRIPWFCFSNSQAAAKMFGFSLAVPTKDCGIRGVATVTVSGYVRHAKEGGGNDIATLKAIQRKSKSEPLPCFE